jgi:hypothetical protein
MGKQFVSETLKDILKPKGSMDVLDAIKGMSVKKKLEELKKMESKWGDMYKDLLNRPEVLEDIREEVKKELDDKGIIQKVNYIEELERELPDIFTGMKDEKLLQDLKEYILDQPLGEKSKLVWRFFKSWPDLFKDVEDDPRIDPETNQIMLLFKIKGAMDNHEVDKLQSFIHELGEKYGRETILDKAAQIRIPEGRYEDKHLFNRKDIEQLKLSLFKETRSEEEMMRDELYDVYAFIGYPDFVEKEIDGETFHKKRLGIENLVKLDKYDSGSLAQVPMMKIRAQAQYSGQFSSGEAGVWAVYIPKNMWDKDTAYNDDIPDNLRKFIEENKFKI